MTMMATSEDRATRDASIRERFSAGTELKAIAAEFGLSTTRIGRIVKGVTPPAGSSTRRAKVVDLSVRPSVRRGDAVVVTMPGITPWTGTVLSVKPSRVSGWWIDVNRDGGGWYVVHADRVTREEG